MLSLFRWSSCDRPGCKLKHTRSSWQMPSSSTALRLELCTSFSSSISMWWITCVPYVTELLPTLRRTCMHMKGLLWNRYK